MASNINYEDIDATFPVAGVDNSTQGFRDNFNIIKNSLNAARNEIIQLQSNSILKSPIPVTGVLDNNMSGSELYNALLTRTLEQKFSTIVVTSASINPVIVPFTSGHYHSFVLNANVVLQLDWGDFYENDQVKKIRVELVHSGSEDTYTIDIGNTYLKKSNDWPNPLQLTQNEIVVLDFWIYKESTSYHPLNNQSTPVTYAKYLGKFS